jgi:hypothetical protein
MVYMCGNYGRLFWVTDTVRYEIVGTETVSALQRCTKKRNTTMSLTISRPHEHDCHSVAN